MTPTRIAQIQEMADGLPVVCVTGRVTKAWPVSTGESSHGPWRKQLLLIQDQQGQKIAVTIWNHDEVFAEGSVLWFSSKNTKQGWQGLKTRSYTKDGAVVKALDASRGCEIAPYPPADSDGTSPDDEAAALATVGLAPAPKVAPPAPKVASNDPKAATVAAMHAAARERNAYVVAVAAMQGVVEFYTRKFSDPMPQELFCGGVTSIKIALERAGHVGLLPVAPIESLFPQLLRPPSVVVESHPATAAPAPAADELPDDLIP